MAKKLLAPCLILSALALAFLLVGCQLGRSGDQGNGTAQVTPPAATTQTPKAPEWKAAQRVKGPENAKVRIMAFFPDDGEALHKQMVDIAISMADKYPGKVRAEYYDFSGKYPDAFKVFRARNLTCGGLLINDKQTFTYKDAKGEHNVTFIQAMNGEWTQADLEAVISDLVKQAYPGK